jgi:haloalkane dehalogenase
MPLEGQPPDVVARVEAYDAWLGASADVPKLLIHFDPSDHVMIGPDLVDWCRANVAALEVVSGGAAHHLAPEDQPEAIAAAIAGWAQRKGLRSVSEMA